MRRLISVTLMAVAWLGAQSSRLPENESTTLGHPLQNAVASESALIGLCHPTASLSVDSPNVLVGARTQLKWSVQVSGKSCPAPSVTVTARPQINPNLGAPRDWNKQSALLTNAATAQGSLQIQPVSNTIYWATVAIGTDLVVSNPLQVTVALPGDPRCTVLEDFGENRMSTSARTSSRNTATVPAAAQAQNCRNRVRITGSDMAPLLVQALMTPNTTIDVADELQLDLTPHLGGAIEIASGVVLLGARVAQPGRKFQRGPRLFVTPDPLVFDTSHWPNPLFHVGGDNVRISGVRLEGPGATPEAWRGPKQGETRAIQFANQLHIEIDHNEFSGWNTAVVEAIGMWDRTGKTSDRVWQQWTSKITAAASRLHYPAEVEPVFVHDNYFHSNWYSAPAAWSSCGWANPQQCTPYDGYGVVASGSHLLVESNVFNDFFHAIAADGCPGSGYRAYRNLVLTHGGVDNNVNQQAFDAHHRRPDDCGGSDSAAGHDFDILWNSFLYQAGPAVFINGTPDVGAVYGSNSFAHDCVKGGGCAVNIANHGDWNNKVWSDNENLEGVKSWDDASHFSDSCDFDGDGKNDRFLTTGETWWFRSLDLSKGWTPWVYLNTSTLLVKDVRLGYISSDARRNHICDVATSASAGYKGGTGQFGPLN
jgi:hypothetical protein